MKKLLIFTTWLVGENIDLSPQSNLWYVQRYENYFDEVTHVFLAGKRSEKIIRNGKMSYVSLGSGNNKRDLLLSPYRLYKFAKEYKPYTYLTYDQVWLFWVAILIKLLLRAKVYLLPITYPEGMYKITKKSLTTVLPIWFERLLLSLSYRMADKVVTTKNAGSAAEWISANPLMRRKMIVADSLPESIPTKIFFDALGKAEEERNKTSPNGKFKLIYVGRFHPEKSVDHLIKMMALLKERNVSAHLTLIGDGSARELLENLSKELNLTEDIEFMGWRTNSELPRYLLGADAFVSPLTGGSLREAALCGLPVIAYDLDWIQGLLKDEETFLAVAPGDYREMADKVTKLIGDETLKRRLSENLKTLAWSIWSDVNIEKSLHEIYDPASRN
jgi:glycosyltransferase involved in cell wall biosynthesis